MLRDIGGSPEASRIRPVFRCFMKSIFVPFSVSTTMFSILSLPSIFEPRTALSAMPSTIPEKDLLAFVESKRSNIGTLWAAWDLGSHVHEQRLRETRCWQEATRISCCGPLLLSHYGLRNLSPAGPTTGEKLIAASFCFIVECSAKDNVVYTPGGA